MSKHRFSNTRAQRAWIAAAPKPEVVRLRAASAALRMLQAEALIRIVRPVVIEVLKERGE